MSLNDFELGNILGKGSFASVILVTRKIDRKIYAMKRINISKMDIKEREGTLNEIRILASLSHPNIIGYKEAFFDENSKTLNIVMEYADDGDIDKKIKDNLKKSNMFSEETLWSWIIQILEGLKYLHDNKIMHRDLKCANLFLMKTGLLKLGDLNVSKIAKLGIAQTQTGTPYYISPEVWEEKPYDYKCDIWSVGCIIYEMCTLRPPFRGTSLKELYKNIKNGYYIPISNYYSKDMKDLISMMLVVDSHKRASADDLLNSNIVKKWIKKIKNVNSDIIENITNKDNNIKANLIKTIKIPKNIGEINKFLPKKRYNNNEEMMKNDKYEIMKETMKKGNYNKYNINNYSNNNKKIDLSWLNDDNRNNIIQENIYNKNNNNNINYNNNNNFYRQQTPNIGKYSYLNKYDNNMRLIQKDKEKEKNEYYNYNNYNNYNYNQKKNDIYSYYDKNQGYNDYRNNNENRYQNYYEEKRDKSDIIYNNRRNYQNNYINNKNNNFYNNNNDKYNNDYNLYQNREKNITPNKYIYPINNQNNIYNNKTPNRVNYEKNNYDKQNYDYNKKFNYNEPYKNNHQIYQRKYYQNENNNNYIVKNNYEYQNNNKKKVNRYKYLFADENPQNEDEANDYNNNYNKYHNDNRYNYDRNNNYRNYNNDRRDIGPRYNLYNFRYNKDKYIINIITKKKIMKLKLYIKK